MIEKLQSQDATFKKKNLQHGMTRMFCSIRPLSGCRKPRLRTKFFESRIKLVKPIINFSGDDFFFTWGLFFKLSSGICLFSILGPSGVLVVQCLHLWAKFS